MAANSTALAARLTQDPHDADAWFELGSVLRAAGRLDAAREAYLAAIAERPAWPAAFNNLGIVLKEDGRLEEAAEAYRCALTLAPDDARVLVNLGNALGDAGELDDAERAYALALELDPTLADAHYHLFAARYDDGDPDRAERHLRAAHAARPEHALTRFYLASLRALSGDDAEARALLATLPPELAYLEESLTFVLSHRTETTRVFTDTFRLLRHAFAAAPSEGLVVELGVRRGTSLRFLASLAARSRPARDVHGFDAFRGLPEAWGGLPSGAYSTQGELPSVPEPARLHVGWFADTLPAFLAAHEGPVAFVHVDCDVYSSTREALDVLAPRLRAGSVLVFDELLENPGWQDMEARALREVAERHHLAIDFVAFGLFTKQAGVRIR